MAHRRKIQGFVQGCSRDPTVRDRDEIRDPRSRDRDEIEMFENPPETRRDREPQQTRRDLRYFETIVQIQVKGVEENTSSLGWRGAYF